MTVGVFGLYYESIKGRKQKFIAWDVREARGPHVTESKGGFFKTAAEFVKMGKCSIVSSLLPQRRIGDEAPEVRNRKDHE